MSKDLTPEWVVATLEAQGVASDAKRTQNHSALLASVLKTAAPAYAKIAFEEEPAGYVAEQRRNAP
jgi:lambda repressor-like predicted transcriptional regulator